MSKLHFGVMLGPAPDLDRCAEMSRLVQKYGFDSLHGIDGAGDWDPYIKMHIMAQNTNTIPLRLSIVNPYYRHPVKIALFAATLQVLSRGRFGVTFAGGGIDLLRSFGLDWVHPEVAIREAIQVFRTLLRGETTNFQGEMITAKGNQLWFDPPQEIPVFVGCQRKWLTRLAGELADGVLLDAAPPTFASWALERLKEGAQRVNRDIQEEIEVGSFGFCTTNTLNIAEDAEVALERARNSIPFSLQTMSEERRNHAGLSSSAVTTIQQLMSDQTWESVEKVKDLLTKNIIQKIAPVGTPEDIIRFIKRGEQHGLNGFILQVSTKKGRGAEESLRLFNEYVQPEFR